MTPSTFGGLSPNRFAAALSNSFRTRPKRAAAGTAPAPRDDAIVALSSGHRHVMGDQHGANPESGISKMPPLNN